MPVALDDIGTYSVNCYRILSPLLLQLPQRIVTAALHDVPDLPNEALSNLRDSIEFADGPVADNIADLLRNIQIQRSRLLSTKARLSAGESVLRFNILNYIVDALDIIARAGKLFSYARRETDHVPERVDENDLIKAARFCGIWDENEDGIYARIRARFGPTSTAREEEPEAAPFSWSAGKLG